MRDLALVFVVALALDVPVIDKGLVLEDEGATVAIAERLSRGQVLYRDAPINLGPAVYELYGALFRVTGTSYVAARTLVAMASASTAALLFLLARRAGAEGVAAFVAPWLFVLLRPFAFPSWHMALYTPFAMALALGALTAAQSERVRAAALAGLLAGLAAVFKQNYGALALLGVLPLCATAGRRLARCAALLGSFGVPPAGFALLYAARGAFGDFFHWTVRYALGSQGQAFRVKAPPVFPLFSPDVPFRGALLYYVPPLVWEHLFPDLTRSLVWQKTGLFELALKAAFYLPWLVAPALLLFPGRHPRQARSLAFVALVFLAFGSFPSCDWAHLCYAIPPTFAALAVLASRRGLAARATLLLLSLGSLATAAFFTLALSSYTLPLPRLRLRVPPDFGRPLLQAAHALAARGATHALVVPYQPGFYHLSGIENPTHADIFLPEFVDGARLREVTAALDAGTPVVFIGKEYAHLPPFEKAFPELAARISVPPIVRIQGAGFVVRIVEPRR